MPERTGYYHNYNLTGLDFIFTAESMVASKTDLYTRINIPIKDSQKEQFLKLLSELMGE